MIIKINHYFQQSERSEQSEWNERSEQLKILTPNQMLKRLPIALAQVKAGNNSESLLNEIRQIYSCLFFVLIKRNY